MTCGSRDLVLLDDTFGKHLPAGGVVGSRAGDGALRRGADVEGVLSIDNQALRIEPLVVPGWGRAGISYGPYRRQNGLAFAALVLNGHNGAQTAPLGESLGGRLKRWLLGSSSRQQGRVRALAVALASLVRRVVRPRSNLLRRLRWWKWLAAGGTAKQKENLAVGWFPSDVPGAPPNEGHALVMRAADGENGELMARGVGLQPLLRGVQNLPIYYVVVLREEGAAYYAATLAGVPGLAGYPSLRPLAVDPHGREKDIYAGVFQSVMGEIGFRTDTRVRGARVARLGRFGEWYGSAHAADRLAGTGDFASGTDVGGRWQVLSGGFKRTAAGSTPSGESLAVLKPDTQTGLIHVLCDFGTGSAKAGIVWRARGFRDHWALSLGKEGASLSLAEDGTCSNIAADHEHAARPGFRHALQVLDDGQTMRCFLDGELLFGGPVSDARLGDETGVGMSADGDVALRSIEAHPRQIPLPGCLDLGSLWSRSGEQIADEDGLSGNGQDLAGSVTRGGKRWARVHGEGQFLRQSWGAAVKASVARPNPGRTLYTVDWDYPEFADVEVTLTPPGSRMGEGHMGRGGLVCWQDAQNYLVVSVWLDDVFKGNASLSSFFRLGGYEEIYDAVWTNVGRRIQWGVPHRLRLKFDGMHYCVSIDGEPVLFRALSDVYADAKPLVIRRVGLAANWEWGDDTGSVFRDFVARV